MVDCELKNIESYMKSSALCATRSWTLDCINYFRAEKLPGRYTTKELQDFVFQQWMLADLREMGEGSLPPNLANAHKIRLMGRYTVQVESMVDIAQSCYGQLQKLRQVSNNVKETEVLPQSWEPRPNRVLSLVIYDGAQEVKAVEYKPITTLPDQLLPGFKIVIIGPVECRKGIILLCECNIKIIGGEVDSMLIPNHLENILARALKLSENPDPYGSQPSAVNPTVTQTESIGNPLGEARKSPEATTLPPAKNFPQRKRPQPLATSHTPVVSRTVPVHHGTDKIVQNAASEREEDIFLDDIPLDPEIDAHLSALEEQFQLKEPNISVQDPDFDEKMAALEGQFLSDVVTANTSRTKEPDEQCVAFEQKYSSELQDFEFSSCDKKTRNIPPTAKKLFSSNDHLVDQLLKDEEDDDLLMQVQIDDLEHEKVIAPKTNQDTSFKSLPHQLHQALWNEASSSCLRGGKNSHGPSDHKLSTQKKITSFLHSSNTNMSKPSSTFSAQTSTSNRNQSGKNGGMSFNPVKNKSLVGVTLPSKQQASSLIDNWPSEACGKTVSGLSGLEYQNSAFKSTHTGKKVNTSNLDSGNACKRIKSVTSPTLFNSSKSKSNNEPKSVLLTDFWKNDFDEESDSPNSTNLNSNSDKAVSSSVTVLDTSEPDEVLSIFSAGNSASSSGYKVGRVFGRVNSDIPSEQNNLKINQHLASIDAGRPVSVSAEPFVYLAQIKKSVVGSHVTYTVKAFIQTLLDILKFKVDGWCLSARLNDGSATLDVSFTADALEKIIGYSSSEIRQMREEMSTNPLIKERIKQTLHDAQQKVIHLNSLMVIKFSPGEDLPSVIDVTDITQQHVQALRGRLSKI